MYHFLINLLSKIVLGSFLHMKIKILENKFELKNRSVKLNRHFFIIKLKIIIIYKVL